MRAWPDAPAVRRGLTAAARRLALIGAIQHATGGVLAAAIFLGAGWMAHWPLLTMFAIAGLTLAMSLAWGFVQTAKTRPETPARIEARAPECRNIVVTAAEILSRPAPLRDDVGARICRDAAAHLARLDLARLFPLARHLAALAVAVAIALVLAAGAIRSSSLPRQVDPAAAAISRVVLTVAPPAYAERPAETLRDPSSITALAGSRIGISVEAAATTVTVETGTGSVPLTASTSGTFAGSFVAAASGFLSIQPAAADGRAGLRSLVSLNVVPDAPPMVRVVAPGHDLVIPDGAHQLNVTIEASDDLALDGLRLAYTKVSGTGENFDFVRGEVPVTLTRTSAREWQATVTWRLQSLNLEPGDMVVYRGLAGDRRPGATPVESDAFIVEVSAPGAVAAEGFAVDDQQDRYALSQRMVIVKTERLIARRASMSVEDFADEALGIAAEQRSVRAEFIFMMGGELEAPPPVDTTEPTDELNEEEEAKGEADLLAGRARNQGRVDLLTATRRMSEAAAALTLTEMPRALTAERAALDALQRAFSKSRYLLRALATREQLDLTRRLTGATKDAAPDRRPIDTPPADTALAALRQSFRTIGTLGGRPTYGRDDAAVATTVADAVLRVDPASKVFHEIAADLSAAAGAMTAGHTTAVGVRLDKATTALAAVIRSALPPTSSAPLDTAGARLDGALADAARRRGGR